MGNDLPMAQLVPERLPNRVTRSERQLYRALARLPTDCLVYFEPVVANRYPDFIIIAPTLGVLTIEVKGWQAEDIAGADAQAVFLRESSRVGGVDTVTRRTHPVRQARDYMFRLMDRCREHRYASCLLQTRGAHQGAFCFPFSHVAILANITVDELKNHPAGDLTEVFPSQRVLPQEALRLLEKADPEEILAHLAACFDPTWPFSALTEGQVKALRAIIHPEIVLTLALPGFAESKAPARGAGPADDSTTPPEPPETPELKVLDIQQERHARQIGGGHRLVFGVAGSGKTVLLMARARLLAMGAQNEGKKRRVLVLCYNVVLAAYLRAALADSAPCVNVFHFDGWAARQGVVRDVPAGETDQSVGKRLLATLQAGCGDAQAYASVLIDEAQDFEPVWFRCVLAAMQDPMDGDLLIVGDGSQGLYRQRKISWKELGVQAQGRTVSARFELDRNYRNSREIVAVARPFAAATGSTGELSAESMEDGIGAPVIDLQKCRRSTGIAPVFVDAADRLEECRRAWQLVRDLLRGRWDSRDVPPLAPPEIGVLYARLGKKAVHAPLLRRFVTGLTKLAPTVWLSDPGNRAARTQISQPAIKVQTIHSAKGLQYRAVVLLWAGDLPARLPEAETLAADRRLFYVGLTRAEDYLAICHSNLAAPFVAEARRAVFPEAMSATQRI